jgi:periplasmic divalent cation tolerance protein
MMSDEPILVCTSVNDIKVARDIANTLLTKKYSPCINIVSNNESIYVWNNDIETTNEYILFIKSVKSKFKNIEKLILAMHPYEIPEILAIDINHINMKYLKWMLDYID